MNCTWLFSPLDTLFFRDATPFNSGETGRGGIVGAFPPSMRTMQGAIRTSLATATGWSPDSTSPIPEELGDSESFGQISLRGPYLMRNREPLFPAPSMLVRMDAGRMVRYGRLSPGPEVDTDIGTRRLPVMPEGFKSAKPVGRVWLTLRDTRVLLSGGLPYSPVYPEAVYASEPRTGIAVDRKTGTAAEHQIYSTVHTRLRAGIELAVEVAGVGVDWCREALIRSPAVRLGGEGRMASVTLEFASVTLPEVPELTGSPLRFMLMLITPGRFGDLTSQVMLDGPVGVPGRCVSACLDKVAQVGGWDIVRRKPRPLANFLPAGSTWFYEASPDCLEKVVALHGQCLGEDQALGYGQVVIGRWEEAM